MKKVDIVIPIYNAFESLKECIKSVIKNTDLKNNGLILINDKSTDERIKEYLKELKKDHKDINLEVLENKENLGFVKTVNVGMKYSNNDVLLLNSDTEVASNWLENIKICAYSGEKIATVTPLSNNATLASVPVCLEKNEIPFNYTFEEYAKLVEECSYKDYPEIPTAHGFCMFIKRDVLNLIGYFDEDSFGKGYGEENDFSFRCIDYGYRNILCDNVIVYHKESQSFNDRRKHLVEMHEKILEKRYPLYVQKLRKWCENLPIKYIGDNIIYKLNLKSKINVLILIHEWETKTGGTTLHVKDIVDGLRDKFNFHILTRTSNGYKLYTYFEKDECCLNLNSIQSSGILSRYNNDYFDMVEDIVKSFKINCVHIHHMIDHYFDIIDIIKKYNLKSYITLHDYYSICPTINMLYNNQKFCENMKEKNCKECLKTTLKINNNIIDDWHNDWKRLFSVVDDIIVPSEDAKKRISKTYQKYDITVIEHGSNVTKSNELFMKEKKFNVAYIGVLSYHKGLTVFNNLIKASKGTNIKFHLFGISEDKKLNKSKNNYIYHGKYKRENINNLLKENNINLVCFFQMWPETYSYTVTEVVASGIPILTFDIGAGAERIKNNNLGWTIPINYSTKDIEDKIIQISNNVIEYNKKVNCIKKYKIKTINEMNEDYKKRYSISVEKNVEKYNKNTALFVKKYNISDSNIYNKQLEEILNSTKWKLVNKINFSPKITNIIRKIIYRKR